MITTAVDDLIHLVKESGKITIAEAATKLQVPQKTVETWVDFLVEEERLSIEYKFTTPYIFLNKDFANEEEELSISKEDFELEIKREEIAIDEGEGKFHEYVTKIINQFKNIQFLISQKKLDQAYEQYNLLSVDINELPKSELANIFNRNLIKLNYGLLMLYKEYIAKSKDIAEKMATLEKTGSDYVAKEEIEQAKKIYDEMKKLYDSIPLMLVPEREGLYDAMYFFFKKIIKAERVMIERLRKEAEVKINHIKSEIKHSLHDDTVKEAEKHLVSLKEIYYSLPSELVSFKLLVYNDILRMYEEVSIAERFEVLKSELDQLGSEIKLPPLSDLIHSPLASAITVPHIESESTASTETQVFPESTSVVKSTSSSEKSKSIAKEEDVLSVLPKIEGETTTEKKTEPEIKSTIKSTVSTNEIQNNSVPSSTNKISEREKSLSFEPQQSDNLNNESSSPKPFDSLSSESFATLLSKENPIMKEAAEAYNQKDYKKAKGLFESILHTDPNNFKAKQMLSLIEGVLSAEEKEKLEISVDNQHQIRH